jgi:hypothetical protein
MSQYLSTSGPSNDQLLKEELSPEVLQALMQHMDPLAFEAEPAPPPEAPSNEFGRTELEETMARLRLQDSLAMASKDAASQKRAQNGKVSCSLPLTKLSEATSVLTKSGVVRIAGGLSTETCDLVRAALCERLDGALADKLDMIPGKKQGFGNFGTGFGFGSTRMKEGRYDMFLPLDGIFRTTLDELLVGTDANLGVLFRELLLDQQNTKDATMFDWSSFTSDPGAGQQPVHPDNQWQKEPPLLTALVALQDVESDMGPTSFLIGTHNEGAHAAFNGGDTAKHALLESCDYQAAHLRKGEVAVFDPRCLHCGGPNTGATRRALLYLSFRNPHCTSDVYVPPGSIFPEGELLSLRRDFGTT